MTPQASTSALCCMALPDHPLTSAAKIKNKKMAKKVLRQAGLCYENYKGEFKEMKRFQYKDCACLYKCKEVLSYETRELIFKRFWNLGSWNSQTVFLRSCVQEVCIQLL